jgi:outer membrane protein assembly factor BamB
MPAAPTPHPRLAAAAFASALAGLLILLSAARSRAASASASAANWPEFRGPHRRGIAASGSLPLHFGPATNVLWSTPVPGGHSSPILWRDRLFLTGFATNRLLTLAFDRRTGQELWRQALEPGPIEPGSRLSHPATATPVTDGEHLVAYFAPFGLAAWNLDGRELWRHPLPTPVTQHGASSSPVLAGDLVVQLCDQDSGSFLLALDRRTGTVRWKTERPASRRGFSTPLAWPPDRPEIVVVAGTLRLIAYDLADGTERWSVRGLPNEMVASPVADDTHVYVAGWTHGSGVARMPDWPSLVAAGDTDADGRLSRDEAPPGPARQHFAYMDADRDGMLDRTEYETIARIFNESKNQAFAVRPGGRGDVTDTHVVWSQTRGLPYVPCPLLHEGRLYLVKNGGLASCLDARTGEFRYREERLGALGDYYGSPVAAGDRLLAISQAGVAVIWRTGDTLEVLARNELGETVLATPALADDTLYLRTPTRLFAFRESSPVR